MFGILVFVRYFSTGFPKVPYGTKCECTETYWQLLNTLQGISAPHWHTALCIQTVGLTAASPQLYLPNKQVSILFLSSLTLHSQIYVPYPNVFCFTSRLRTVYTSLANIYWEYSILSQLRSRIEKNPFASLHYTNQTRFVFSAKPFLLGFHFTLFSTVKIPTLACFSFWLKLHHSTHSSGAFI